MMSIKEMKAILDKKTPGHARTFTHMKFGKGESRNA
jgi:hypothetical protein